MVVLKKSKGKRKNMRGGGAIDGIYVFHNKNDNIYFFSDLEGNMPYGIKELMFETTTLKDGEKIFEMDGIIEKPKSLENNVIVFTGDLIDRGEYSIRNLIRILALKEKKVNDKKVNAGRVILLCGNRDTNKIRMYHECHIKAIEDNILRNNVDITVAGIISKLKDIPDSDTDTLTKLFTNNGKDIATIINITGILKNLNTARTYDDNFKKLYRDDISRIEDMYSNTLGSPKQVENFKKEFKVLFGIDEIGNVFEEDNNTLLKFIAMMNMVMGKIWDNGVLPTILEPYNGLYIKYLQQCHIMAIITIGDKLCFASHAGIPYKEAVIDSNLQGVIAEPEGSFYIPKKIGDIMLPVFIKTVNIYGNMEGSSTKDDYYKHNNIIVLNKDFTNFINSIAKGDRANLEGDKVSLEGDKVSLEGDEGDKVSLEGDKKKKYTTYKKYVAMSANCDIQRIDNLELSAYASPIVSRKTIEEVKNKRNLILDNLKTKGTTINKIYNIFGHQPSGLLPYISNAVSIGITSYHIDLDISRAEGDDSNKDSYVYLKMTKDDDMLFGKIKSKNKHDIIKDESNIMDTDTEISFNYVDVQLDTYCENSKVDVGYSKLTTEFPLKSTFFTVDNTIYYGMFYFTLVETHISKLIIEGNLINILNGGRGKTKIYTKSIRRFLYGKRKMVIYVGKRGGEYVKVKGEYMSLAKFNKKINNKK